MKKLLQILRNIRFPIRIRIVNPFPFQFFKMYYKIMQSRGAIVNEGLDLLDSPTWAVVSQLYFKFALPRPITSDTDSYYLSSEFIKSLDIFRPELYDEPGQPPWMDNIIGIRFYFGLTEENKLILLLSTVYREQIIFGTQNEALSAENHRFYISQSPENGEWRDINRENAKIYLDNFKNIDVNLGKSKSERIRGYFLGEGNINEIMGSLTGIKVYLGLFGGNEPLNYEDPKAMANLDLQLNIIALNDPTLEPLGSFRRIFSTIENDRYTIWNGYRFSYSSSGTASCIKPCPSFCGDE